MLKDILERQAVIETETKAQKNLIHMMPQWAEEKKKKHESYIKHHKSTCSKLYYNSSDLSKNG